MMRGLQTPVRQIRRQVFTKVAELGFKANAETLLDDMEAIPYEIVNDDTETIQRKYIPFQSDRQENGSVLRWDCHCARKISRCT